MLKVNIHNYEAYFLDYAEGNLSGEDRKEVEKFLALYPDKFDELQEFENITVPVEASIPFDKSVLKRGLSDIKVINDDNFEEFCIANLEEDLDDKATEQYFDHLKHFPEKKKTEELYKKVYLVPDKSIKYPHKSRLKHFERALFVRRLAFAGAAAASIGLLFTLQNPFNKQDIEQPKQVISQNVVDTPKEEGSINTGEKTAGVVQNQEAKIVNKTQPDKAILVSQNKIENRKDENTQVEASIQRQPILLQKASISKPKLEMGTVSASQLALRNEVIVEDVEEVTPVETKKVVSLTELAFNEVKKVVPEGVQELADKRPVLRDIAQNSKREINDLLNKQVTIEKEIDEEGNMKSFSLNTSLFAFYTTKVKK